MSVDFKERRLRCFDWWPSETERGDSQQRLGAAFFFFLFLYYSAIKRNETGSFAETWMDLETVRQSEVSQTEKNKYHILTHICGIWKNWYRQSYLQSRNRDTDVENRHMDTKEEKGEGGMNWEIGTDIYTLLILCIKQITNENLLYSPGNCTQCSGVT